VRFPGDRSRMVTGISLFSDAAMLSVIIPCWNDANALGQQLDKLAAIRRELDDSDTGRPVEIVVADASTTTGCRDLAAARGAIVVPCDEPSRGRQLNLGASHASGAVLLFQHVDTALTVAHVRALLAALELDPRLAGGAFHRLFDARHPRLRWLEPVARFWAGRGPGLFYGDQSIFVRRLHFEALGGFADFPLMEDLDFARRLKQFARRAGLHVALLDPPIATSARRHQQRGAWRTSLENGLYIALYHLGVSPRQLHRWYYRQGRGSSGPTAATANAILTDANPAA
jgi:glycosyltransferase involved in cell wall biosynthesis